MHAHMSVPRRTDEGAENEEKIVFPRVQSTSLFSSKMSGYSLSELARTSLRVRVSTASKADAEEVDESSYEEEIEGDSADEREQESEHPKLAQEPRTFEQGAATALPLRTDGLTPFLSFAPAEQVVPPRHVEPPALSPPTPVSPAPSEQPLRSLLLVPPKISSLPFTNTYVGTDTVVASSPPSTKYASRYDPYRGEIGAKLCSAVPVPPPPAPLEQVQAFQDTEKG